MRKSILCAVLPLAIVLLSAVNSFSAPNEKAVVRSIAKEIKELQKAGVAIHKKYNFSSVSDVKACVAQNGHLREKGKLLKQRSQDTSIDPYYLMNLIPAADAAFVCVYCRNIRNECSQVTFELRELEKKLKSNQADQPIDPKDKW